PRPTRSARFPYAPLFRSGLAVALTAALRGRRSVVLEASDKIGGAAAWSGGQVWVGGNHVAARAGIDDDLTRAEAYVRAIGAAHQDRKSTRLNSSHVSISY